MTEKINISTLLSEVSEIIKGALLGAPELILTYTQHLTNATGKMFRARLLLVSSWEADKEISQEAKILAAAAELVHLASLVHDDVMDRADKRRGIQTLNSKFSDKEAVICGDYIIAIAIKLISRIELKEKKKNFPDYASKMCEGQLREFLNINNVTMSAYTYFRIIKGKTAALFEAVCFAGASLCEAEDINRYKKIGHYSGMAFQLMDDYRDVKQSTELKNANSDIKNGVVTLPQILAFCKGREFGEEKTYECAKKYIQKAIKEIELLKATESKKQALKDIILKIQEKK
ncbi:MAG: polyprenyl synthetase family protein [Ruminococcaceae bacterium]|nr:polyprenyl synthetase family protein [Oscillospiraceae bacterium]